MKLYENDSGKTVEINVGDRLEIVLPAKPSTGYLWEVSFYDANQLTLSNPDFYANGNTIGSNGTEVIKLQAIAEGQGQLKVIFHRPFERSTPPLKTFEATIFVKN